MKINQPRNRKAVLLSIKPEYADLIERGCKRVEFRRRFSEDRGSILGFFYVTSPVSQIRFVARIEQTIKANPSELWHQFQQECGVSYIAFSKYFEGTCEGTALVLSDVRSLRQSIDKKDLRISYPRFSPPQSYKYLSESDPLFIHLRAQIR